MCIFNEKRCGYGSCDVYDIFEITGFTELPDVKNALRKVSVPGCERNGRDGHGNVYRLDEETIIKVYHANNVMVQPDGELVLIDMADISRGNALIFMSGCVVGSYMEHVLDSLHERYGGVKGCLCDGLCVGETELGMCCFADKHRIWYI